MLNFFNIDPGTIILIVAAGLYIYLIKRIGLRKKNYKPSTPGEYLYKISRITGKSEYEIFMKSAEEWPVSKEKIDKDFKDYLSRHITPYYVNNFIRKNKKYIDEIDLPPHAG